MTSRTTALGQAIRYALATTATLAALPALAQDGGASPTNLDRIEITGSRIRQVDVETSQHRVGPRVGERAVGEDQLGTEVLDEEAHRLGKVRHRVGGMIHGPQTRDSRFSGSGHRHSLVRPRWSR